MNPFEDTKGVLLLDVISLEVHGADKKRILRRGKSAVAFSTSASTFFSPPSANLTGTRHLGHMSPTASAYLKEVD